MAIYDVVVVGAGPAGLIAAGRAAERGAKVLVLELMRQEGLKLLLTGKGRCNITNEAPISEFITHIFPNGRFLKPAFSNFFSKDIIKILNDHGVETVLERGGRYFPATDRSADVLNAILKWVKTRKVEILTGHKVDRILHENGAITGVESNGEMIRCNNVIIATGGRSYPATGSSGDGYTLSSELGHKVETVQPALVPLNTEGNIAPNLQGLNLKNVNAVVWIDGKKAGEKFGEMIFTHFGLSGPIILTLSRIAVKALMEGKKVEFTIDLKPALDDHKLEARLLRDLNEHGKMQVENIMKFWLPSSMIPVFIDILKIDANKYCHQVNANERKQIRVLMKNFKFTITGHRSYREAIITAGGISLEEISSKTMMSKLVKGLFFAGEVMDLDAETGGYNLQIAYSTGWLAGSSVLLSSIEHPS